MTRPERTQQGDPVDFEIEVEAMLQRRARDVDVVATTRVGRADDVSAKAPQPQRRSRLLVGVAAACVLVAAGVLATLTLRTANDVTSEVSQPPAAAGPTPTAVQTKAAIAATEDPCESKANQDEAATAICRTSTTGYTVLAGDTLGQIAKTYGITLDSLLQANPDLEPASIVVGSQIVIPPTVVRNTVCPDGYSVGRDTNGDDVIDTCYQDLAGADAAALSNSQEGSTAQQEPPPATWAENEIGGDAPIELHLWTLQVESSRYSALANQATNRLRDECVRGEGFDMVDIDLFAERSIPPIAPDFELAPFSTDGGYALTADRGGSDSTLGPIANGLLAEQAAYVDALSASDRSRYEDSLSRCDAQARSAIFDGPATSDDFYALVNIGINLQSKLVAKAGEHPTAQAQLRGWQQCMSNEGHDVTSRTAAIQAALDERYQGGQTAAVTPGPIELGLAGADRRCSASLGYGRSRSAALGAAERYLLAHDPVIVDFVESWTVVVADLRPKLVEVLGPEIVEQLVSGT